jgi:hypothetical protein
VSGKTVLKFTLFLLTGCVATAFVFLVYAYIAGQVEASRVEAAIKRDCSMDVEINPDEIDEPGIVSVTYEVDGTPQELVCYGAINWSCDCDGGRRSTPAPVQTPGLP